MNQLVTLVLLAVEFSYSRHLKGKIALLNTTPTNTTPNAQKIRLLKSQKHTEPKY